MPKTVAQQTLFGWWLRGLIPAVIIGAVIGLAMSANRDDFGLAPAIIGGAIIGICCHSSVWALQALLGRQLEKLSKGFAWVARGLMYVIGGSLGFFIGLVIALRLVWGLSFTVIFRHVNFAKPLMIAAIIALFIGVAAYSYHELKHRLEVSVARLKEHEFAEKELELARAVQARLLAPQETEGQGFRISARNLAARYVAGDFYDIFPLSEGSVGIAVADVSGKGMAASLIMASVKAALPLLAGGKPVAQTLTELNAKLSRELGKREFVALAFARFDAAGGRLEVANAGLPDPYLLRLRGAPAPISPPGPRLPLGVRASVAYQSAEVHLQPGDRFFMFSDGLPEAPVGPEEQLGYEGLSSLLSTDGDQPPGDWLDSLFAAIRARSTDQLEDDWTALVLERT